ncbi:hypothetical protein SAMN05444161_2746 [Rhizobiales bacterium GAS191]|nr:hypothetical protein SAMN05444161_2746 [Rhizobiales bacterium GAS191]
MTMELKRIVAGNCPLTFKDLHAIKLVRSQMRDNGYRPLAVQSPWSRACDADRAGKAPVGRRWQNGQPLYRLFGNHPEWSRAGANTGLLLGVSEIPVQAFDADIDDPAAMAAVLADMKPFVPLGALIRTRANSPRVAILVRCEPGVLKEKLQGEFGAVERLALGQQTVVHGMHPTGVPLDWLRGRSPWAVRAAALPFMDEVAVDAMFAAIAASGALGRKLDRTSASASRPGVAGP